jgi:putative tricarboxylic transport membrane protein
MELLSNLALGLQVAMTGENILYCFGGVALGTLIGVLPGIGPVATISMLLPLTFKLEPTSSLIMLAGIYYGAQYGGSTTAILVNLPGEASSVVTCLDGYAMARQGRAGHALAVAAIGSFVAGCIATLVLAAFAPPLSELALKFGAPEYFSLMVLGLVAAVVLAQGSVLKALAMIALGILLGLIGMDGTTGDQRFTFGLPELSDGVGFVVVAMGLFGFGPIIANLESTGIRDVLAKSIGSMIPPKDEMRRAWGAIARGTGVGSLLGILPGGGAVLGSFASYMLEKRIARDPSRFGKGAIEGVAGPESANNAAAQTSFIPMLTLGLPTNPVMALMVGAMIIQGIQPGPMVITKQPELFWGMIVSMWLGNLFLVVLNLPLIGIWVRLLSVRYRFLYPAILVFCCIGIYSLQSSVMDVYIAAGFGLLGYIFIKLDCEPAPLLIAFVLGPMMEDNFRRALTIAKGDPTVFVSRPISASILAIAAVLLLIVIAPSVRKRREEVFKES